jgi:hypothetical protein
MITIGILLLILVTDLWLTVSIFNKYIQPKTEIPAVSFKSAIGIYGGLAFVFSVCIFFLWGLKTPFPNTWDKWESSITTALCFIQGVGFIDYPNGLANPILEKSYILMLTIGIFTVISNLGVPVLLELFHPKNLRERMINPKKDYSPYLKRMLWFTVVHIMVIGFVTLTLIYSFNGNNSFVVNMLISLSTGLQSGITGLTYFPVKQIISYNFFTFILFPILTLFNVFGGGYVSTNSNLYKLFWNKSFKKYKTVSVIVLFFVFCLSVLLYSTLPQYSGWGLEKIFKLDYSMIAFNIETTIFYLLQAEAPSVLRPLFAPCCGLRPRAC